jgi:hypothetical protein
MHNWLTLVLKQDQSVIRQWQLRLSFTVINMLEVSFILTISLPYYLYTEKLFAGYSLTEHTAGWSGWFIVTRLTITHHFVFEQLQSGLDKVTWLLTVADSHTTTHCCRHSHDYSLLQTVTWLLTVADSHMTTHCCTVTWLLTVADSHMTTHCCRLSHDYSLLQTVYSFLSTPVYANLSFFCM